ncbi:S66 peptidase family protein [Cohnella thailandensis]|uniref:LD-carboxypeptidase n=1 Tax=Cohnella thailandensis TaxID=557557 RepID=A0A841SV41_9BACL|nr:LD-carboxypeptidase [Cohnella thailandensis]MBB6634859.1 LD-carboxypeptidase [Cohnella thailandensis]MBP1975919.1 muramoyltetrapeptide carboxypeptidase [Cohnella thailandensis]
MAVQSPALRRGDTVGIVTLGSPLDAGVIRERIRYLEGMGFRVVVGRHVFDQNGFLAGSEEGRAADLMAMFADPNVRLILPSRGGVGVEGILPYLDFGVIRSRPKLISGYSDITVLLNAISQFSGLVTLHSLMLIDFKPETPAYNFNQFFAAASSSDVPRSIANPPEMAPMRGRVPGNAFGPLAGGNLTSLVGTLGTPYEIDTRGKVLLLEETHEPINTVYRYLEQMKLAGKFDGVAGIVMGECTNCADAYGKSYEDLIEDFMVPLGKPLVTGIASGHGTYKAALPIGAFANLDASSGSLVLMEPAVG